MQIRPYRAADEPAVVKLWEECGLIRPWNDPHKDIARKLTVQPEWFLVGLENGRIIGSIMAGYEGHRGWVNYLAVSPAHRRNGLGRMLMEAAEQVLLAAGCPKVSLQVRVGNDVAVEFYRRLGYDVDDVLSLGRRLISDTPDDHAAQPQAQH